MVVHLNERLNSSVAAHDTRSLLVAVQGSKQLAAGMHAAQPEHEASVMPDFSLYLSEKTLR